MSVLTPIFPNVHSPTSVLSGVKRDCTCSTSLSVFSSAKQEEELVVAVWAVGVK